jgi:hypothetical protein
MKNHRILFFIRSKEKCGIMIPQWSMGRFSVLENIFSRMVPTERIELPTFGLQNRCTTAVLRRHLDLNLTSFACPSVLGILAAAFL